MAGPRTLVILLTVFVVSHALRCRDENGRYCHTIGKCFIRLDKFGGLRRGCTEYYPELDVDYQGCRRQVIRGDLDEWCLCSDRDLCNAGSIDKLRDQGDTGGQGFCTAMYPSTHIRFTKSRSRTLRQRVLQLLVSIVRQSVNEFKKGRENRRLFFIKGLDKVRPPGARKFHNSLLRALPGVNLLVPSGTEYSKAGSMLCSRLKLPHRICSSLPDLNLPLPITCPFKPVSCNPYTRFRTVDGKCNNLQNPLWGSAITPQPRFVRSEYDDGFNKPRQTGQDGKTRLPSARKVSLVVHQVRTEPPVDRRYTHMLMQWGQFLDHDLVHTPVVKGHDEADLTCCPVKGTSYSLRFFQERDGCFPIEVAKEDPQLPAPCMDFVRSAPTPNLSCKLGPREQINQITSFIDASNIYGSSEEHMKLLRTFVDGNIQMYGSKNHFLKRDERNEASCVLPKNKNIKCAVAGDERVNVQMALTSIHTTWAREHNRIAKALKKLNWHWRDNRIFHEARRIVGAFQQHVTYGEFLPVLLGDRAMETYKLKLKSHGYTNQYNGACDPSIRNVVSTAAFRMGHSLVRGLFSRCDKAYRTGKYDTVRLRNSFFRPYTLHKPGQGDVESFMRGLLVDSVSNFDHLVTGELTNHLFGDPVTKIGLDLVALNIQRGRDHGLPGYNEFRRFCKGNYKSWYRPVYLNAVKSFSELSFTHSRARIVTLKRVYKHVNDIDIFTGLLTERPLPGSFFGPTLQCILGRQFQLLRQGDRFWYETNDLATRFTKEQLASIRAVTFSGVLCNNHDIDKIQPKAFLPQGRRNALKHCKDYLGQLDLSPWKQSVYQSKPYDPPPINPPTEREYPGWLWEWW